MFNRFLVPEEDLEWERVKALCCSPSIHPRCQFYHSEWINCESDGIKKKKKKVSKDLKEGGKKKKSSGVPRPWHRQAQLITADMMGGLILGTGGTEEGDHGSFTCIVHFFTVWLNSKVPPKSPWQSRRPWIPMSSIHHLNKQQRTEGPALRSSVSPTNPEFSASQSTYLAIQSS